MSNNLTLYVKKFQFKQSQATFFGHHWSKDSISPCAKKIQALNHMKFPEDKEKMRSFLGMINYLNKYSAMSAYLYAPLGALTHKAKDYKPTKEHFKNFELLKKEISMVGALPYFDINAETTLQTDVSKRV